MNIGGWAFQYYYKDEMFKDSGGLKKTTNNKAEMLAVIEGLCHIIENEHDDGKITVFSDSQYVINGASIWLDNWKQNGWIAKSGHPIKNRPLWEDLDFLIEELDHNIVWKWIRGHNGNPHNEAVDFAARQETKTMRRIFLLESPTRA